MKLKLIVVGIIVGALSLWFFSFTLEKTNEQSFCVSCHEMEIPKERLMTSFHGKNKLGIVAECSDCHVPKPFFAKMARKISAAREVWGHMLGIIDTPEKYEAHKSVMRERELGRMIANDSAECRNCHNSEVWDLDDQGRKARKEHESMADSGKTCVSCHDDIAHAIEESFDM